MGKKKKIKASQQTTAPVEKVAPPPVKKSNEPWYTVNGFKFQAILLAIIGLICFANCFSNKYALDDEVIILKNQYVQQGAAGIPKIMSSDALASFYAQYGGEQQLSGGRYRPLSIVTFALEQQLLDSTMDADAQLLTKNDVKVAPALTYERHVTNVLLYILSVLFLLYFLRTYIFKEQPLIPFLTCLLFLIHPMHTEVVANIKSRDEIFSFLFYTLTFIQAFKYYDSQKKKDLYWGLLFYFLAFLSKEYAITMLVLLPMLFCIVKKDTIMKSLTRAFPFFLVALLYIIIRTGIVGTGNNVESPDLLNNPFLFADNMQRLATKIEILDRYLWLLIHPTVLSSDYSYNTIPYADFGDIAVWVSLFILIGMIVATIILFRKRSILSFALAFYLLHLFLVSNLMFDLGATMGERLVYHSSFGFFLIVAIGINYLLEKINQPMVRQAVLVVGCLALVFWCAAKDIERNAQWKNNGTLFLADVNAVPNSALSNGNAGQTLVDSAILITDSLKKVETLNHAIVYLKKAITIHTKYVNGYLNLGYAYYLLNDYDIAKANWDTAKAIFPTNPFLGPYYANLGVSYSNLGIKQLKSANPELGVISFEKAVECSPTNVNFLNNLGMGYYYIDHEPEKAKQIWERSLQVQPGNTTATQAMLLFNNKQ
ncbi:MAG TPA: hypothetical protein VK559_12930 [Ferruginibacter sp.]|nr:hypothetical protein [Ferruginibacter sp.]